MIGLPGNQNKPGRPEAIRRLLEVALEIKAKKPNTRQIDLASPVGTAADQACGCGKGCQIRLEITAAVMSLKPSASKESAPCATLLVVGSLREDFRSRSFSAEPLVTTKFRSSGARLR